MKNVTAASSLDMRSSGGADCGLGWVPPPGAEGGADEAVDVASLLVALCAAAVPCRVLTDIVRLSADPIRHWIPPLPPNC